MAFGLKRIQRDYVVRKRNLGWEKRHPGIRYESVMVITPETGHLFSENASFTSKKRSMDMNKRLTFEKSSAQVSSNMLLLAKSCTTFDDGDMLKALRVEARLLELLGRHPHVLKLLYFVDDGHPGMIITEFPINGTLQRYLQQHKALPDSDLTAAVLGVASAMAYLEANAITHRALSVKTVYVGSSLQHVRVAEFGMGHLC